MTLYFVRHGETTGDVENRYGGTYDDHLSEKGLQQSKELAATLKNSGIEVIFASSLIRTQETAADLAETTGARIETVPDLRERNQYGHLSGMLKTEAMEKYPEDVEYLKDRLKTMPGAETYEDFSKRMADAFQSLTENSSHKTIAILSHGGPLRVLFRDILKWGELKEIGDCSFVELTKDGDTFTWVRASGITPLFEIPNKS